MLEMPQISVKPGGISWPMETAEDKRAFLREAFKRNRAALNRLRDTPGGLENLTD